jgi:hypothetical protein
MVIVTSCMYDACCVDACDWYYTHHVVVCVCVGLQEVTSRYVITGQQYYDVGGISLKE